MAARCRVSGFKEGLLLELALWKHPNEEWDDVTAAGDGCADSFPSLQVVDCWLQQTCMCKLAPLRRPGGNQTIQKAD